MKYKADDKVKIKTWKTMEKEYGLTVLRDINTLYQFTDRMEKELINLNTNRVVIITGIYNNFYCIKEMGYCWTDKMIECLYIKSIPILSRFELLDL